LVGIEVPDPRAGLNRQSHLLTIGRPPQGGRLFFDSVASSM
jgi:hypothetical protein